MKRKVRKRFRMRKLILIGLVIYLSTIFMHQRTLMGNLEDKRQKIEVEVKSLEKDIEELTNQIENSDSLEFVEKIARDELGMVKPREIIYIDKNKVKNPFASIFKKDN